MRLTPVLAGLSAEVDVVAELPAPLCPACGEIGAQQLAVLDSRIVLLFVPLLHWRRRYFSVCGRCGHHQPLMVRPRPAEIDLVEVRADGP